jgi:ubiquitin carboxyl-terminal hydrolase 9/13
MLKGPILELKEENSKAYGMGECTFTGMRDLFQALIESQSRTGVLSPQRFLEVFKKNNEMFQNSMHQDAHEFYGLVLNDIISNVEENAKRMPAENGRDADGLSKAMEVVLSQSNALQSPLGPGWVNDVFEGVLTSETKCLTCETASQRDEKFLDLSIDLDEHSSVTSCLSKFSREEMLCERNKFHCDHCGGLQEAEKRMKIHRLPKVLAFHLKRFKYTEDFTRLQKLFHRVVYPYHLRMFNTTDDAEEPDRLYELYAVVVHIGGNAYHGHYVSVIKTKDRGWVLFDDEMVEPVDKHFVKNFFGDKPGMACAYVLFYQETTFEKIRAEQEMEGLDEIIARNVSEDVQENGHTAGANGSTLARQTTAPISPAEDLEPLSKLAHAQTAPLINAAPPRTDAPPTPILPLKADPKSKEDKKREKKEAEAAEKARKHQAKLDEKRQKEAKAAASKTEQEEVGMVADEAPKEKDSAMSSFLSRSARGSKSMSRKSFGFLGKDKERDKGEAGSSANGANGGEANGPGGEKQEKLKERFTFGIGKKKSTNVLS